MSALLQNDDFKKKQELSDYEFLAVWLFFIRGAKMQKHINIILINK